VFILRLCGAKIGPGCRIYASARIWAPWNLVCGENACIGDEAEIYNVAPIYLGKGAIVSQGSYLCAASHDFRDAKFPLIYAPIRVEAGAWVAARAIVFMGVTIGERCVIGAGSVVTKSMPAASLCGGNPCRVIGTRQGQDAPCLEDKQPS
jgi:putative colanic acid biosynthesis acetyltransferase WcaF